MNLPGQWCVLIIDISYPHQWTTIHRNLTYAVLFLIINAVLEYGHKSILYCKQPINLGTSAVNTEKLKQMPQLQANLFDYIKEINFLDTKARYEMITKTISKGKHTDIKSIVQQIASTITTLYSRRFPKSAANKCDDNVTYYLIIRWLTFKNIMRFRYLIAEPTDASIILLFGHGARSVKIRASSEQKIDVLPLITNNSAHFQIRIRNPLLPIKKVNLRTLDNVLVYTKIIEQSHIRES